MRLLGCFKFHNIGSLTLVGFLNSRFRKLSKKSSFIVIFFRDTLGARLANPIRGELGYAHWPQAGSKFGAMSGPKLGAR